MKARVLPLLAISLLLCAAAAEAGEPDETGEAVTTSAAVDLTQKLDAQWEQDQGGQIDETALFPEGLLPQLIKMLVVLGAVCAMAYLLLGKALPKLMRIQPQAQPKGLVQVVDRAIIDQRRSLLVVKMGTQHYLLGATDSAISLIAQVSQEDLEEAVLASPPQKSSLSHLARVVKGKTSKEE